jgi:hypothetical protein
LSNNSAIDAKLLLIICRKRLASGHPDVGRYLTNLAAELRNDTAADESMKTIACLHGYWRNPKLGPYAAGIKQAGQNSRCEKSQFY